MLFSVFLILGYYFFRFSSLNENKIIFLEKGKTLKEISFLLEKNNVISNKEVLNFYFKVLGKDKNIRAGEYKFYKNISLYKVIKTLNKSELIYRKITIPECMTVYEIVEKLKNNKYISGNLSVMPTEGTLYPETYFFLRDENINDLIKRMQNKMTEKLDLVWKKNYQNLKSKNDLLIMASLIEAEAKKKNEKFLVSSVFHNRLKKEMKLQSDPTILYKKNLFKKNKDLKIYKKDLKNDNPWNTYTRKGLPITPICNPGIDAIKAAANPLLSDYLYFVSDGEGGHRFSSSLKRHNINVKIWKNKKNEQ